VSDSLRVSFKRGIRQKRGTQNTFAVETKKIFEIDFDQPL